MADLHLRGVPVLEKGERGAMRTMLLVLVGVVGIAGAVSAQSPVVNPSAVLFQSPSHTSALSQPTEYEFGWFQGGAAPVQSAQIARSVPVPVSGTNPQEYRVPFTALPAYPVGQLYTMQVRARNTAGASAWSNATVPFGQAGPPDAPTAARIEGQ